MAYLEAGSGTSKPVGELQAEVYFDLLKHLPADAVRRAAKQALAESQYPTIPPVGVLLRLAGGPGSNIEDRARVAYLTASRAVRTEGGYASVEFDDALINATIRLLGGWQRFCDWPPDSVQWRQRDFEQSYRSLSATGASAELCAPLAGIIELGSEHQSAADGFGERIIARIPVNLPALPGAVRGELKRIEIQPAATTRLVKRLSIPADEPQPDPPAPMSDEEFERRRSETIRRLRSTIPVVSPEDEERMAIVNGVLGG